MNETVTGAEPTKEEKHTELMNKINTHAHAAGVLAYNIQDSQSQISDHHVKIRNLSIDANKLYEAIQKEKAEEHAAKAKLEAESAPKLELVPQDQESCIGGTDVVQ